MGEGNKKPINILIATGLYPPDIGGPATHVVFLEEHLPKDEFSLTVVPFGEVRKYPKIIRHFIYAWRLWRQAKETDLIYALDPVSVGLPAMIVSKLRRQPFVLRLGGDYAWEQGVYRYGVNELPHEFTATYNNYGLVIKVMYKLQSLVAKQAVKVITPSEYLKDVIKNWRLANEKIDVIYNPFTKVLGVENKSEDKNKVLLAAGRLNPIKCFSELIEVMPTIVEKHPEVELRIAGDGPDEVKIKEQIKRLNLNEKVFLLGPLTKDELFVEMSKAKVFIQNSKHESFPNILLESISIGLPVIATAVGGTREVILDGENGLLINSGDKEHLVKAVDQVLSDAGLVNTLKVGGKKIKPQFETSVVIDQLTKILSHGSH